MRAMKTPGKMCQVQARSGCGQKGPTHLRNLGNRRPKQTIVAITPPLFCTIDGRNLTIQAPSDYCHVEVTNQDRRTESHAEHCHTRVCCITQGGTCAPAPAGKSYSPRDAAPAIFSSCKYSAACLRVGARHLFLGTARKEASAALRSRRNSSSKDCCPSPC